MNRETMEITNQARCLAGVLAMALSLFAFPAAGPLRGEESISSLKRDIAKAMRANKDSTVLKLARQIASSGDSKAASTLFDVGLKAQAPRQFNGIAKILALLGEKDETALAFLEKESKGSNEAKLVYLTDIAREMKKNARGPGLLANMTETKSEAVLRGVISALQELRLRECVPPLLALLERFEKTKSRGLIYQEVRDALYDLSGEDFETIKDWQNWWEPLKDSFKPGEKRDGVTGRMPKDDAPEFAGKKIFAHNAVFVIDVSGTMQYVMKDDIPGLGEADGTDAAKQTKKADLTPENERLAKFWTRMEMAKRALLKALRKFSPTMSFNVAKFDQRVIPLEKKSARASPGFKKKAATWVKNMKFTIGGATNTKEALKIAFSVDRRAGAVFFLSDGLPSADGQKNDDPMPILDFVETLNRFRKIKVHTFGYDPQPLRGGPPYPELVRANKFLKTLAERTGGTFTLLKVTDEKPPPDFKSRE